MPDHSDTVYTRTMFRAMEAVGGPVHLAELLKVPVLEVWRWVQGETVPPIEALTQALEIVARGPYNASAPTHKRPDQDSIDPDKR
jgi:hypothetical protein